MNDPPGGGIPPPAILATGAAAAVLAALPGARAVGGLVRDALAGRPLHDIDIAAPLPPETVAARLRAAGLRVFETGLAHGTVTAVLGRQPVEVTSLRRDVATDGRHAAVEWTTDWREDAARRDFTINAMSMAADGRLWDYFAGREDLAAGRVRFVGDPATRLREDYLRALRFFRFQARYGRGAPDPAAIGAIRDAVPGLARLSPERVWIELKRLLAAPDPGGAVALMDRAGVLRAPPVLPEAGGLDALARLPAIGAPPEPILRLAALLPSGPIAALADRLRFSGEETAALAVLQDLPPVVAAPDAELRRRLSVRDHATLHRLGWLAEARGAAGGWAGFHARLDAIAAPVFPLQGRDVLALGVPPGLLVGQLLHAAREAWREGGCVDGPEACGATLRRLVAAQCRK